MKIFNVNSTPTPNLIIKQSHDLLGNFNFDLTPHILGGKVRVFDIE